MLSASSASKQRQLPDNFDLKRWSDLAVWRHSKKYGRRARKTYQVLSYYKHIVARAVD